MRLVLCPWLILVENTVLQYMFNSDKFLEYKNSSGQAGPNELDTEHLSALDNKNYRGYGGWQNNEINFGEC